MKLTLAVFILCLAASCAHSLNPNAYEGYEGNPHKVETYTYYIVRDSVPPDTLLTDITVDYYDSEGHKRLMESYDSLWNKSFGDFEFKYDQRGHVTMWINRAFGDNPELTNQYEYTRHGLVSKKTTSYDNGSSVMTGQLNSKNRTMELSYRGRDGEIRNRETAYYDKKWRKVKQVFYDKQGYVSSRKDYRYDARGNQVEMRDNKSIEKQYFNSQNDLIRKETFALEMSDSIPFTVQRNSYKYDPRGNWTEQAYFLDDVLIIIYKKVFHYPESK